MRVMKLSPQEQTIMDRMAPGVYCRDGFLGDDRRPLNVIVDTDHSTLEGLGIEAVDLAGPLQDILDQTVDALGAPVPVRPGLEAEYSESMGRIPCPYGDGVHRKGEVTLRSDDGTVLRFTPLSVHLIAEHGFFQGKGSRYRLEPEALARLLGLVE